MTRKFLKLIYLSPVGSLLSAFVRILAKPFNPFMVYGYYDRVSKTNRKFTRVSSSAILSDRNKIAVSDYCWIWHYSILDGSNGITIHEGAQIGAWVGIFTHGSQAAIRLHGKDYIFLDRANRLGYERGAVEIGAYTFVGASATILPGVCLGEGCVVAAGALVTKSFEPYSIIAGAPAKKIGDTRKVDSRFIEAHELPDYYNPDLKKQLKSSSYS